MKKKAVVIEVIALVVGLILLTSFLHFSKGKKIYGEDFLSGTAQGFVLYDGAWGVVDDESGNNVLDCHTGEISLSPVVEDFSFTFRVKIIEGAAGPTVFFRKKPSEFYTLFYTLDPAKIDFAYVKLEPNIQRGISNVSVRNYAFQKGRCYTTTVKAKDSQIYIYRRDTSDLCSRFRSLKR